MRRTVWSLLVLAPMLGACRYSFVPIIPPQLQVTLPPSITAASMLRQKDDLVVSATLSGHFGPAYLSVVWYDGDTELGRDSAYLDNQQKSGEFRLVAPAKGSYRALLSYDGVLLRQVELRETGEF